MSCQELPPLTPANLKLSKEREQEIDVQEIQLATTSAMGFVYVQDVDEKKRKLIVLTPRAGRMPRNYMMLGTLRWAET